MLKRSDFIGQWVLDRRIDDRITGQTGAFEGTATVAPVGAAGAAYHEVGILRLGDGPGFTAERRYLWQFEAERVVVQFEDGRAFHSFCPEGEGAGSDHPCGADYYQVVYDFGAWPRWQANWTVSGPRKDYRMRTAYRRG